MKTTRKDFIDGLRKEGYSIPLDDLKDLIEYYEELLDEQEIGKDDYVPDEYDYKKIIREFKLSGAYKEVKTEKKTSVKKSLSLIILSIVCMPILLVLLIFISPGLLLIPIGLFVFSIIAFVFLVTSFSLIWSFGTSSTFLFILGIILIICACLYLCIYSLVAIIRFVARKFSDIALKNKKFNFNANNFKKYTSKKYYEYKENREEFKEWQREKASKKENVTKEKNEEDIINYDEIIDDEKEVR